MYVYIELENSMVYILYKCPPWTKIQIQIQIQTLLSIKYYIKWKFSFRHTCSDW